MNLKITGLKVDATGEGSRGGKIIGHTSSGRPIYGSHGHPRHAEFSKKEHNTAANLHDRLGERQNAKDAKQGKERISAKAKAHFAEATKHRATGAGGGLEAGAEKAIQKSVESLQNRESIETAAAKFRKRGFDKPGTTTVK